MRRPGVGHVPQELSGLCSPETGPGQLFLTVSPAVDMILSQSFWKLPEESPVSMEIAWFKKIRKPRQPVEHKRIQVPEGLWVKCNSCKEIIYKKEVLRNANVCPKCNYHFRISARERLSALFDDARYQEVDTDIYSVDPLKFRDVKPYKDRLREYREKTGLNDAIINARGTIGGLQTMRSEEHTSELQSPYELVCRLLLEK